MGTLDDAIREHLELKRRQGTSEDELEQAEKEALGRGPVAAPAPEQRSTLEELDRAAPEPERPSEQPAPAATSEPRSPDAVDRTESWLTSPDEIEPDEVLPEEVLDPDTIAADERLTPTVERISSPDDDLPPLDESEDVLEETPEFLEETPEHDRLWFEQKPPKDFDFGD